MTQRELLEFHVTGIINNIVSRQRMKKLSWSDQPIAFSMSQTGINVQGSYLVTKQPYTGLLASPLLRTLDQSISQHLTILTKIGKELGNEKSE